MRFDPHPRPFSAAVEKGDTKTREVLGAEGGSRRWSATSKGRVSTPEEHRIGGPFVHYPPNVNAKACTPLLLNFKMSSCSPYAPLKI